MAKKKSKEVKPKKLFKAVYESYGSFGYSAIGKKFFKTQKDATSFVKKEWLEDLKKDEDALIIIYDVRTDERVEVWRNESGKVVHYPEGWGI